MTQLIPCFHHVPHSPVDDSRVFNCVRKMTFTVRQRVVATSCSMCSLYHRTTRGGIQTFLYLYSHVMLSEIYHWFTEGFDTKDLQEAKALLLILAE